jgi:AcrR family transcriptional regulator
MARPDARDRLLTSATRLLAKGGLEAVNSNQIAREAGVGVGTFYAHFPDKRAVQQTVVLAALDALRRRVERDVAASGPEPEQQVRGSVEAAVAFAEEDPDRFRVAFGGSPGPGGRAGLGYSGRGVERRLRQLQGEGRVDPRLHPAVAARAFASAQAAVLLWWLEDPRRAPRDELVETLVRLHPALIEPSA